MTSAMTPRYYRNAAMANPDDIGLLLVTFDHVDLAEPIHVSNCEVEVVSNGVTYVGWPLAPRLPSEGDKAASGGITIQNVDPRIGNTLLGLKGDITVFFDYVSREVPDESMWDHGGLFIRNVQFNDATIEADVVGYGTDPQMWPKATATPATAPGLWV